MSSVGDLGRAMMAFGAVLFAASYAVGSQSFESSVVMLLMITAIGSVLPHE